MNRELIAVGQVVLSVAAGFAFGFLGIPLIVGGMEFGVRVLLGTFLPFWHQLCLTLSFKVSSLLGLSRLPNSISWPSTCPLKTRPSIQTNGPKKTEDDNEAIAVT